MGLRHGLCLLLPLVRPSAAGHYPQPKPKPKPKPKLKPKPTPPTLTLTLTLTLFLTRALTLTLQALDELPSPKQTMYRVALVGGTLAIGAWWFVSYYLLPKRAYNAVHPYTSFVPIFCYMVS